MDVSDEIRYRVKAMIAQASQGQFVRGDFEVFGDHQGDKTIVIDFSLKPILMMLDASPFFYPKGAISPKKSPLMPSFHAKIVSCNPL